MQLRDYQLAAKNAVYRYLRTRKDNPLVVIPTAGGKTPVMAEIARESVERWGGVVLILTHVAELLEQTAARVMTLAPSLPVGIYSAGMGQRDIGYAVTLATIQSVWQKAEAIGHVDLVLVDEAHMIPKDGEDEGMFRTFLAGLHAINPKMRAVGLTGTPFRTKGGLICGTVESGAIFQEIAYEIGVDTLTTRGFLSPIVVEAGPKGEVQIDVEGIKVRAGDFVQTDMEFVMGAERVVSACCLDIAERTKNRRSVLLFAAGVEHGKRVAQTLSERHGLECGFVSAATPKGERAELIQRFCDGDLKYLCNVQVLTTGFDSPRIDCVGLLRPTMSPGLYVQMVGRGLRIAEGKTDCLVLDYVKNTIRHGFLHAVREGNGKRSRDPEARSCPGCFLVMPRERERCPRCSRDLPRIRLSTDPDEFGALVDEVVYSVHEKRGSGGPMTMRVEYHLAGNSGSHPRRVSEWLCFDHAPGSRARRRAEHWWSQRSRTPTPRSVRDAVRLANAGALAETNWIDCQKEKGELYFRPVRFEISEDIPEAIDIDSMPEFDEHEVEGLPF